MVLPVFPLSGVAYPLDSGVLRVFQPQYLSMFRDLLANAWTEPGPGSDAPRFIHCLSTAAAPRALLMDKSATVEGLPRVACTAAVRGVQHMPDGTMEVRYEVTRRVQLINLKPYGVGNTKYQNALAEWYDDEEPQEPELADELEAKLYAALHDLAGLSSALGGHDSLPPAVHRYAPPAGTRGAAGDNEGQGEPLVELLKRHGKPAAAQRISTWRRASGMGAPARRKPALDPYDRMREELGKEKRQEMFSFAAAAMLEADTPTRTALLMSRDTAARMAFVIKCLEPYAQQLRAQAAVQKALSPNERP